MPCHRRDGAANRLLDMFRNPPVVFLFEIADGDDAGTGTDSELRFGGGPANEGGGAVDTEEDECRFVACRGRLPD